MRRALGAAVVMGLAALWNLIGAWSVRDVPLHDFTPPVAAVADSFPQATAPAPVAGSATSSSRHSLPADFRDHPLVFLSSAPAESLDLVPGVGPVLAARLIEIRRTHGPFRTWDDVLRVKGIGPRTLERWQALAPGQ